MKAPVKTDVTEQSMPPCHDIPSMQLAVPQQNADHAMPCCDDGKCSDAQCMMPAGTHFSVALQDYFLALANEVLIRSSRNIYTIKPSPPIRPPIA